MPDELGFIHMNGRLHNPIHGRFLQADPVIQDAYNAQNYNHDSYVLNNPLVYIGNSFQPCCAANLLRRAWFIPQTVRDASAETA